MVFLWFSDSLDYGYSPPVMLQWPAKSRQIFRAVGSALVAFLADALGGRLMRRCRIIYAVIIKIVIIIVNHNNK